MLASEVESVRNDEGKKADAYATALFVCDKEQRDRLLQDKDIKVMMVDKDLNIAMYNGFETLIA